MCRLHLSSDLYGDSDPGGLLDLEIVEAFDLQHISCSESIDVEWGGVVVMCRWSAVRGSGADGGASCHSRHLVPVVLFPAGSGGFR